MNYFDRLKYFHEFTNGYGGDKHRHKCLHIDRACGNGFLECRSCNLKEPWNGRNYKFSFE